MDLPSRQKVATSRDQDQFPDEFLPIERLPVEVRVIIYGMLPYSDLLKIRSVNRQCKKDVDEHMNFHLKLDQSKFAIIRRLASRRIKSCHILHFSSKRLFPGKVFGHPKRLKKLIFDGVISPPNLLKILNQCHSVEHLIFTHQTLGIDGLIDPQKFGACLHQLTSVTHLNLQLLRYPQGDPFEREENIEAFLQATFPHLHSFRLYFSLFGNFATLLSFLGRHKETLRELELQVGDRGDSYSTEQYLRTSPMKISESDRRKLLSLKFTKFRFRDDVLNLNNPAKDLIMSIMLAQRNLEVLQFYSPGELSWSLLKEITHHNENVLTEIVVYNVKTSVSPPNNMLRRQRRHNNDPLNGGLPPEVTMDMTIFSKCSNLKTLALSCASSNGNNPNVQEGVVMKMTNLQGISESVERLHLLGFTLDGQELVNLSSNSNNLNEVLIADAGAMKYSDVLNSFLKNCCKLKYLNVRPVVLQAANEQSWWNEVNNLSKLYERFMGISYDPIDDLEGFEANISESDKEWLKSYNPTLTAYSRCTDDCSVASRSDVCVKQ